MRAIGDTIPKLGLDVLALQEVWTDEAREKLVRAGRKAGLGHTWHRSGALRDGGLLVLSRLPVLDARFERYALPGQPPRAEHLDYYAGKGFLQVRLAGEHGPFQVFDTHLHARYGSDVPHEYASYRVGQIVQLAAALRETNEPAIVAGDFNLREDTDEYRILCGLTGLRDVAALLDRREPTVYGEHPFRTPRRSKRIDYLFLRDGQTIGLRPRSVARTFDDVFEIRGRAASYSDHAGLMTDLEFGPVAGNATAADPDALRLAANTLREGLDATRRRQREDRVFAGVGLSGALLAGMAVRNQRMTRRRLLRASFRGAAALALAPALGFSVVSELYAPDELRAFESLTASLDSWKSKAEWIA